MKIEECIKWQDFTICAVSKTLRIENYIFENIEALSLQAHTHMATREGKAWLYTDKKVKEFQKAIHYEAKRQRGRGFKKFIRAIETISFFFQTDNEELHGKHHDEKPDLENLEKAFNDAIEGALIVDDKGIVKKHTGKYWSSTPMIILILEEVE